MLLPTISSWHEISFAEDPHTSYEEFCNASSLEDISVLMLEESKPGMFCSCLYDVKNKMEWSIQSSCIQEMEVLKQKQLHLRSSEDGEWI